MVVVDGRFWRVPAAGAVRQAADSYRRIGHLELTRAHRSTRAADSAPGDFVQRRQSSIQAFKTR
jgi:hypothetical protein